MPIWHQSPKLTPRYFLETPRLFGYPKPLLPARVSRRCFHFVQAILPLPLLPTPERGICTTCYP